MILFFLRLLPIGVNSVLVHVLVDSARVVVVFMFAAYFFLIFCVVFVSCCAFCCEWRCTYLYRLHL